MRMCYSVVLRQTLRNLDPSFNNKTTPRANAPYQTTGAHLTVKAVLCASCVLTGCSNGDNIL